MHSAPRGALAQGLCHAAPVNTCRIGIVQRPVHRAQWWEERDGGVGGYLAHSSFGTAGHPFGEWAEPSLLALAQAEGEKAASGIARALRIDSVRLEPLEEARVVIPCVMSHVPPERFGGRMGVGRQDAGTGIGGPAGTARIDNSHPRSSGGQFVGRRQSDQSATGDGHVTGGVRTRHAPGTDRIVHAPQSITLDRTGAGVEPLPYDVLFGVAVGAALRASGTGGAGAASSAFNAASSVSTDAL